MALGGQVQIDHGGVEAVMPEVLLDAANVDTGFEQMSGITVAKGMDGNPFFKIELCHSPSQGALDGGFFHRHGCRGTFFAASPELWKDQAWVAMGRPIVTQGVQGDLGQGDIPVLGALAAMDMDAHALFVNIADLQVQGFVEPQSTGINGGEIGFVLRGGNGAENSLDFIDTEHRGQAVFPFDMDERQGVPVALEHIDEEEFDAAVADPHGGGRPFVDISAVQKIVLKLGLGNLIRGF